VVEVKAMPNQYRKELKVINIRIEPELKARLADIVAKYNAMQPDKDKHITQADVVRDGITRELNRIERKLKS